MVSIMRMIHLIHYVVITIKEMEAVQLFVKEMELGNHNQQHAY